MTLEKLAFIEFQMSTMNDSLLKIANIVLPEIEEEVEQDDDQFDWSDFLTAAQNDAGSQKLAGMMNRFVKAAPHLNEVAGLGVLAAPSVASLSGNPMSDHTSHAMELGGLGILAGPSAYHAGKALLGKAPKQLGALAGKVPAALPAMAHAV